MTHHRLSLNQYLILAFVSVSVPLGDASLSRGMTGMPPISAAHPLTLIGAVFTPWIARDRASHRIFCQLPDGAFLGGFSVRDARDRIGQRFCGAAGALLAARADFVDALDGDRDDHRRGGVCSTRAGEYYAAAERECGCFGAGRERGG